MLAVDGGSAFPYRGGIALASLLTAVMVASLPGPPSAFTAMHQWPPLAWVGERSYGIYLWHWPVILVVAELRPPVAPGADPPVSTALLAVALTFGLAEASYRWVEMPIRHDGFGPAWAAFRNQRLLIAGAAAVVVLTGMAIATAPTKSDAQLAVEAGERAIAAQAAAAGSTQPLAWPDDLPVPGGDQIIGFGDSVLSGAAPAIYQRFPGVILDAKPIRQWRDAPAVVRTALDDGTARPVVILCFGTNAGLKSAESRAGLAATLDALGPDRRVVLVNTVGVSDWVTSTNATLASISADHPNTIVADWHAVVAADPTLLHTDKTHPNMRGIDVYADLLAQSLDELGPR
jgi:lysophospholipase L1-like esterase